MKNFVITNKGQELISKMIAGTATVQFTKIKTTDKDYSSSVLETLTDVSNERQTALVSGVSVKDISYVEIFAALSNETVDTGYYVRTLGLYATDSSTGAEILFAVSIAEDEPDFIPAFTGNNYAGISYKFNVKVDNSAQVNITVDPMGVVLHDEFVNTLKNYALKSDIKSTTYTATIGTKWNGSSAPYSQTITVTGLTYSDTPIIDVVLSSTLATALAQEKAWQCVSRIVTGSNSITVYCNKTKPVTAIPIQIKVVK